MKLNKNKSLYKVINISKKKKSLRRACVKGSLKTNKNVINLIKNKKIEKGDPIALAEIAGINAIKNTSNIILLCHQINIENAFINIIINEKKSKIIVYCTTIAYGKTGVEMEAFCGANTALLTIYDLTKKFNPFSKIENIKLIFKDGGENGLILGSTNNLPKNIKKNFIENKILFKNIKIYIITISDRGVKGTYEDISGQLIIDFFKIRKAKILKKIIIPDDEIIIKKIIYNLTDFKNPNIIIINGGTGISEKDITYKTIKNICNKIIPGISEFMRYKNTNNTITSILSSYITGIYKKTIIVSLPGNPSSVLENLNSIEEILYHCIKIIK